MAKRRFKTDLSVKGIENLKKELLDYKNNILQKKIEEFTVSLAERGMLVAKSKIGESPLGKYIQVRIESESVQNGKKALLIATGDIKKSEGYEPFNILLAVEFGAGIYYNPNSNPNADKFGLGVGTFPGQIHAFEDGWYYWDEKKEKWQYTHGVKATMPMYNAEMEMMQSVVNVARNVFGK